MTAVPPMRQPGDTANRKVQGVAGVRGSAKRMRLMPLAVLFAVVVGGTLALLFAPRPIEFPHFEAVGISEYDDRFPPCPWIENDRKALGNIRAGTMNSK